MQFLAKLSGKHFELARQQLTCEISTRATATSLLVTHANEWTPFDRRIAGCTMKHDQVLAISRQPSQLTNYPSGVSTNLQYCGGFTHGDGSTKPVGCARRMNE